MDGREPGGKGTQAPGVSARAPRRVSSPAATSSIWLHVLPTAAAPGVRPSIRAMSIPGISATRQMQGARLVAGPFRPSADREQEGRRAVEGILEHRLERVPETRVGDQLGLGEQADPGLEEIEPGEGIALPREEQDRAADRREMGRPFLGLARRARW